MSEPPADRPRSPASAPAPPPLTEDQLSGALFVRWNLAGLVIGLICFGLGLAALWYGWVPAWRDAEVESSASAESGSEQGAPAAPAHDRTQ